MSIAHNVVDVEDGGYERGTGRIEGTGVWLTFFTNFPEWELAKWKKAIRTFKGQGFFGIAREAWGFNEEEGYSYKNHSSFGFYAGEYGETLSEFWRHFETVKVYGTQVANTNSKRTAKKMMRYGLRIRREADRWDSGYSSNSVKKFKDWWLKAVKY